MSAHPLFFGLINGGATCWLNATYQSLVSLGPLLELLLRHSRADNPAHFMLAETVASQLSARFFRTEPLTSFSIAQLLARSSARAQEALAIITRASCDSPDAFYASAQIRDYARAPYHLPFASCALLSTGDPRAALYLFCALVIYCASTGARPVPEYRSIGEVGPAMLETIIGALCFERDANGARELRELFSIDIESTCLCFDHARDPARAQFAREPAQMCIQVAPNACAHAFIASVQVSVDVCEKKCACTIPGVMGIEYRANFGPIITIMTDDMVARGLTTPSVTSVYRRNPIGSLQVPRAMTLADGATYTLIAQIIQEGGHFTAQVARARAFAYISDQSVSAQHEMTISPGCVTLFYVRDTMVTPSRATIPLIALAHSMRGYTALNRVRDIIATNGMTPQPLLAPQSIADLPPINCDDLFKEFYFAAIGTHISLASRAPVSQVALETLFAHKTGAKYASLIACSSFSDSDFSAWHFLIAPAILAILAQESQCDAIAAFRADLEARIRANPRDALSNLADSRTVRALPEHMRAQIAREMSIASVTPATPTLAREMSIASVTPATPTLAREMSIASTAPIFARARHYTAPIAAPKTADPIFTHRSRPAYVSPELIYAYERMRLAQN
jgi:hypothetical protein